MKLFAKFLVLPLLFINLFVFSQTNSNDASLKNGTIEEQFEYVLKKSSNYQNYKVVKRSSLNTLKSHVIDSLKKEKRALIESKVLIEKQKKDYLSLQQELQNINEQLNEVTKSKDTIKLLGIPLKRDTFKTLIWSLLFILAFALLYFVYLFKNSNKITQQSLTDYNELENEYNTSRARALEREQVLNRKLQDELNKLKKPK